jgi:hypothetical protein
MKPIRSIHSGIRAGLVLCLLAAFLVVVADSARACGAGKTDTGKTVAADSELTE